jgi:uncharacterized membrane protein
MLKTIGLSSVILLILDGIYLSLISKPYSDQIKQIQGSGITAKPLGVIACYALLIFGINWFIIWEKKSPAQAFVFGLVIYGVYDATNYALLNKWDGKLALLDTLWGGILFGLTTWLVYKVQDYLVKN